MKTAHPDQRYGCVTHAQHGDDLMLLSIFDRLGIEKPFYIDIGAHHPSIISNTRLLYERGARGINVDANRRFQELFDKERPFDKNLCGLAIGETAGEATFHMYSDTSGRNTISPAEVKSLEGRLTVKRTETVRVITYDMLVRDYAEGRVPHLLLVDAEGKDYDILRTIDFVKAGGMPLVICVETRIHDTKAMVAAVGKCYTLYCRMGENLFFVRDDVFAAVLGMEETPWATKSSR